MAYTLVVVLLVASTLVPGGTRPLAAQSRAPRAAVPRLLMAIARSDLSFGTVLAGIPSAVEVHDPRRAGLFEIQGPADGSVRVDFILPTALATTGGALLPVQFVYRDGFADFSMGRPPRGVYFDPHTPLVSTLGPNGRLFVHLGGTALPGLPQTSGIYRATIYLTVSDLGS